MGGSCAFQGKGAGYGFQASAVGCYAVCISQTVQGQPLEGKKCRYKRVTAFGYKPPLQLCLGPYISPMLATSPSFQISHLTSLNTSKRLFRPGNTTAALRRWKCHGFGETPKEAGVSPSKAQGSVSSGINKKPVSVPVT